MEYVQFDGLTEPVLACHTVLATWLMKRYDPSDYWRLFQFMGLILPVSATVVPHKLCD